MFWDRDVVIRVDGGICSQISFVAMGLFLSKACGQSVSYDLGWYREHGRDNTGTVARRWDFPLAFPGLKIKVAEESDIARARKAKCWQRGFAKDIRGPAYVCGYPENDSYVLREREVLSGLFRPEVPDKVRCLATQMEEGESCAVHVRRGDLSVANAAYGRPASILYFVRAMAIVRALAPDAKFFIFSDEPDWVRAHLLREVPADLRCTVCEANGSDRGHADLWLISRCPHVIASQGSLGLFGALLSGGANRTLVLRRHDPYVAKMLPHVMYINDDCGPCQEGDVK